MDLQTDQIAEAGRDFWRPSTSPALLPGAGAAQAGWPGLRLDRCWAPPRMEISQPLWAAHSTVRPSFKNKNPIKQKKPHFPVCLSRICISASAHCLLSFYWIPLMSLAQSPSLPPVKYLCTWVRSHVPFLPQPEQSQPSQPLLM